MADLSIFKLDNQTITIKDTTAREAADSAKTLATTASGNATTALNKINELESEKADAIISSASGAIASFPDGAEAPVKSLTVAIEPVQEGTGNPSPDNVRPISGWTGCVISHSGADTSNPTTYPITFPSEAGTVYGGELTVNEDGTGRLVVDRTIKKLNELSVRTAVLKNGVVSAYIHNFANQSYFGASGFDYSKITCTVLETKDRDVVWGGSIGSISSWNQDVKMIIGTPIQEATPQAVSAWLSSLGDDEIVVWPLLEPITYALTALEVLETLKGVNNVWADTGDMSVTYRADTKLYIDKKFTELQALILEN